MLVQVRAYLVRLCSSPEEKLRYAEAVKVGGWMGRWVGGAAQGERWVG